jgi:hypothetical protein
MKLFNTVITICDGDLILLRKKLSLLKMDKIKIKWGMWSKMSSGKNCP